MHFFQETTPDTSAYMIAGYTLAFLVMGIYLASLIIRWRNLNQDLQMLESMQSARPPAAAKVSKPKPTMRKTGRPGAARKKK